MCVCAGILSGPVERRAETSDEVSTAMSALGLG